VTRLGEVPVIKPAVIESLFAADLAYLEDLYLRLNSPERLVLATVCPECSTRFAVQVAPLAEDGSGSPLPQ
jgi:hypothetical protein